MKNEPHWYQSLICEYDSDISVHPSEYEDGTFDVRVNGNLVTHVDALTAAILVEGIRSLGHALINEVVMGMASLIENGEVITRSVQK